jgi:hypothetical protein
LATIFLNTASNHAGAAGHAFLSDGAGRSRWATIRSITVSPPKTGWPVNKKYSVHPNE